MAITRFARFLADVGVEHIDQIDRAVLERYLADLRDRALIHSGAAATSAC